MKFYIATSLSNAPSHNLVRDALVSLGHEITYDWTSHGSVKTVSKERLKEVAVSELAGVLKAEFLLVLLPGGSGTHLEFGFAMGSKKNVFIHSRDPDLFELGPQTNAFYHHPDVKRLTCPLEEVASEVNAALLQPADLYTGDHNPC